MTDDSVLAEAIGSTFARSFSRLAQRTRALCAGLTEDEFWTRPYPYGNSVGHLVLHLTGNLSYYIGARIANTGYVRNRDLEFTDVNRRPKEEVLQAFEDTAAMVARTAGAQRASEWLAPYEAVGADAADRFAMVLQCAAHFQHHIGQMIYLTKELERQRR